MGEGKLSERGRLRFKILDFRLGSKFQGPYMDPKPSPTAAVGAITTTGWPRSHSKFGQGMGGPGGPRQQAAEVEI